jgi:hypothetical protein
MRMSESSRVRHVASRLAVRPGPPAGQGPLVMLALAIGILLMTVQLWLLTLALNLYLGGVRRGTVIAAVISGVIFTGGLCVIHLLERRLRPRD